MNKHHSIRNADIADLQPLSELFDLYRRFYGKSSNIDAGRDFLSNRIQRQESIIFVSTLNESILTGFVQLYPLFSSTRLKRLLLLNDLFVRPEYRGQGISIQLINASQQFCKNSGACGLSLETAKTNLIGNNLYVKTGFIKDTTNNYYQWFIE